MEKLTPKYKISIVSVERLAQNYSPINRGKGDINMNISIIGKDDTKMIQGRLVIRERLTPY